MSIEAAEAIKEYYWSKLCQFKFDLEYYGLHFNRCVSSIRIRKVLFAIGTAIFAGAWMEWNDVKWINKICPIAVFILQVLSAIVEFLPHDNRQIEIREMVDLLEPVYRNMETDWVSITVGEYTIEEIKDKTNSYQTKIDDIKSKFFRDDFLPQSKKISEKALSETNKYFEINKNGGLSL